MTKPTKWVCAQWRLGSALASTQSDQSSLCIQWVAKDASFLHVDSEDWSDWVDAQADLSLRCVHTSFVGFVISWLIYGNPASWFGFLFKLPLYDCYGFLGIWAFRQADNKQWSVLLKTPNRNGAQRQRTVSGIKQHKVRAKRTPFPADSYQTIKQNIEGHKNNKLQQKHHFPWNSR